MDAILNFDARIWGLALFAVMSFAWLLGRHMLMDPDYDQPKTTSKIEEAGMALFGLLVAFCFAGAADRYEGRKVLLLHDAISIGDFATTASTLQEPARTEIHNELVRYVEQRLAFGKIRFGGPEMPAVLAEGRQCHERILNIVRKAVAEKNTPSVHAALLNGFNGMTKAHDERLYGTQNHVPLSIVGMLMTLAVYTSFILARMSGAEVKTSRLTVRALAYLILIAIVFTVTIDLEQPRRGMMRVSQAPMMDLLAGLKIGLPQ